MPIIFTPEYIKNAPNVTIEIIYPDGAHHTARVIDDGNGMLAGLARAATCERASTHAALSSFLDTLRGSHLTTSAGSTAARARL